VAVTISLALTAIVTFGSMTVPFAFVRSDPATTSAPFVATLVDVNGLVIYFSLACVVVRGTLLQTNKRPVFAKHLSVGQGNHR
jgi:magnesium transporter